MPEISRFFGIVIQMYWDDHNPPHFHESESVSSLWAVEEDGVKGKVIEEGAQENRKSNRRYRTGFIPHAAATLDA